MGSNSPNHSFYLPDSGEEGWGVEKNNDWSDLDTRLVLKDTAGNRPSAGTQGRWFLATDQLALYYDNGSSWDTIVTQPSGFAGTFLSTDGSGNLQVDIGSGLENDGSDNISVAVGDGLADDGSGNIEVPTDAIQTDELDLSITPTWTGTHTYDAPSVWLPSNRPELHYDSSSNDGLENNALFEFHDDNGDGRTGWFGWHQGKPGIAFNNQETSNELVLSDGLYYNGTDVALTSRFPLPNSDLQNASVDVAGNSVSLGGSTGISASDLSDSGNVGMLNENETVSGTWTFDSIPTLDRGSGNDPYISYEENGNNRLAMWHDVADDRYIIYHYGAGVHGLRVNSSGVLEAPQGVTSNGSEVVTTDDSSGYEIQKDGTDGTGVINFKT